MNGMCEEIIWNNSDDILWLFSSSSFNLYLFCAKNLHIFINLSFLVVIFTWQDWNFLTSATTPKRCLKKDWISSLDWDFKFYFILMKLRGMNYIKRKSNYEINSIAQVSRNCKIYRSNLCTKIFVPFFWTLGRPQLKTTWNWIFITNCCRNDLKWYCGLSLFFFHSNAHQ